MPNRCRPTVRQVLAFGPRLIEGPGGGLTPWRSSSSQVAFCAESVSLVCSTAEALLSWRYSGEQGGWNTSTMARLRMRLIICEYSARLRPEAPRRAKLLALNPIRTKSPRRSLCFRVGETAGASLFLPLHDHDGVDVKLTPLPESSSSAGYSLDGLVSLTPRPSRYLSPRPRCTRGEGQSCGRTYISHEPF